MINNKILDIVDNETLLFLLAVYHKINGELFSNVYENEYNKWKKNAIKAGVISFNEEDNSIIWNIPLYKNNIGDSKWDWVEEEYIELFARVGKGTHKKESVSRMKKLFAENPDIRKEDIIGATTMYLSSTDVKFIRFPHYFISKGIGSNRTQDILSWIDKYRELKNSDGWEDNLINW